MKKSVKPKTSAKGPPPVPLLLATADISAHSFDGPFRVPEDWSEISAAIKALKNYKEEVIVQEMPVRLGYVPKSVMQALKRANVHLAQIGEVDIHPSGGQIGGVAVGDAGHPPGFHKNVEDAFERVWIRWTVRVHRKVNNGARRRRRPKKG